MLTVLFSSTEFWSSSGAKTRRPLEDHIAVVRQLGPDLGSDLPAGFEALSWVLSRQGHAPWDWSAPNGYPDVAAAIAGAVRCEHGFGHTGVMYSTNVEALSAMARTINCSIYVKNGSSLAGLGYRGEGYTSFTIASPTGEGMTTALSFTRERRCTMKDAFRFV
jgi:hypothetical protein